jgi:hypothetical protein
MDANSTIQLSYTAGVSYFGSFYVHNQPDRALTWPSISWDTVDNVALPLTAGDGLMTVIGVYERFVTLRRFLIDKNVRDDVSAGVTILRQLVASTYP